MAFLWLKRLFQRPAKPAKAAPLSDAHNRSLELAAVSVELLHAAIARRIKWHESLPGVARKAVCDGLLDEGHIEAISGAVCDVACLQPWLTTETAQTELTREVLDRHRGSSVGVKPTVAVVRKAAKAMKDVIHAAEAAVEPMSDEALCTFVDWMTKNAVRSVSGVERAKASAIAAEAEAARLSERAMEVWDTHNVCINTLTSRRMAELGGQH